MRSMARTRDDLLQILAANLYKLVEIRKSIPLLFFKIYQTTMFPGVFCLHLFFA